MKNSKNSTAKMHFACAIVFITFTYLYLACYQGDVLAVAQHVLSDGKTDYSYTFAPLLTTFIFYLLQLGVFAATRVKRTFHALNYFPSFLFLTMITDIPNDVDVHHSFGGWWIAIRQAMRSMVSEESVWADFSPTSSASVYFFSFIKCSIFILSWNKVLLLAIDTTRIIITTICNRLTHM